MARETWMVNEVFYSVQGEGMRAGTANVFVRLSGCNLTCSKDNEAGFDCDTEFVSGRKLSGEELLDAIHESTNGSHPENTPWVILTGGEPGLQVNDELIALLHGEGYKVAIETNGTQVLPEGIDWITCSPKSAEHTLKLKHAHELKYVRHASMGIPRPTIAADHYLLSPAFESLVGWNGAVSHQPHAGSLATCIELVKKNPTWRLSVQQHKTWGVR